jgi:hypothetical protein
VLDGRLTVRTPDGEHEVEPGEAVCVAETLRAPTS